MPTGRSGRGFKANSFVSFMAPLSLRSPKEKDENMREKEVIQTYFWAMARLFDDIADDRCSGGQRSKVP